MEGGIKEIYGFYVPWFDGRHTSSLGLSSTEFLHGDVWCGSGAQLVSQPPPTCV